MPQPLHEFASSPAAVPLAASAAESARERGGVTTRQVAAVMGLSRVELTRRRSLPLARRLIVTTDEAAPDTMQPTQLIVEADRIMPSGLTFRHRTPFAIRRLIVEIDPPRDQPDGPGGAFHATVVGTELQADGCHLTTVRFTSVV